MKENKDGIIRGSSFLIKIKYHQNNSIQGTIQWLEKKKIVNFRSMMELIMLLNETVDKEEMRKWESENGTLEIMDKTSQNI